MDFILLHILDLSLVSLSNLQLSLRGFKWMTSAQLFVCSSIVHICPTTTNKVQWSMFKTPINCCAMTTVGSAKVLIYKYVRFHDTSYLIIKNIKMTYHPLLGVLHHTHVVFEPAQTNVSKIFVLQQQGWLLFPGMISLESLHPRHWVNGLHVSKFNYQEKQSIILILKTNIYINKYVITEACDFKALNLLLPNIRLDVYFHKIPVLLLYFVMRKQTIPKTFACVHIAYVFN